MKLRPENQCRICGNVFCCEKCRGQHEKNTHSVEIARLEDITNKCVICCDKPLRYHPAKMPPDVLAHIVHKHFPLHCRNCSKVYFSEKDLQENWKCLSQNQSCKLESGISIAINSPPLVEKMASIEESNQLQLVAVSTQTSPSLQELDMKKNGAMYTPIISLVKAQSKSITDSASSFKNISSFNSSAPTATNVTSSGSKLERPTSTPMQQLKIKTKGQHFDSSSQVSSIHGSSSESELVHSGGSPGTTKAQAKLARTRGRGKMPVSATPLRQVMSKSIQRAIAEHGTLSLKDKGFQPKKIFDSMSNSLTSPLDLRTSPVLRRTQSEVVDRSSIYEEFHTSRTSSRKHILSSSRRIITEDLIISTNSIYEKLETVYETCRSIDTSSIQLKSKHILNESPSSVENISHVTPKTSAATLKNARSFEHSKPIDYDNDTYDDDVFYTPKCVAPGRSYTSPNLNSSDTSSMLGLKKSISSVREERAQANENNSENVKPKNHGRFWSLLSSVVRLASFGSKNYEDEANDDSHGMPKRCASFTGVLRKPVTQDENIDTQKAKRKRTNTFDAYSTISPESSNEKRCMEEPTKKVMRIQGRRPIKRMRKMP